MRACVCVGRHRATRKSCWFYFCFCFLPPRRTMLLPLFFFLEITTCTYLCHMRANASEPPPAKSTCNKWLISSFLCITTIRVGRSPIVPLPQNSVRACPHSTAHRTHVFWPARSINLNEMKSVCVSVWLCVLGEKTTIKPHRFSSFSEVSGGSCR